MVYKLLLCKCTLRIVLEACKVETCKVIWHYSLVYSKRRQLGYWIVFRDGEQRMLLFTTNRKLRDVIVRGNYEERPQYNVSVSLQSIGISLVNDTLGLEVAYIGITQ